MISKKDFRIIFMGTPEFAVESLKQLVEHGYNVVAVVTNPDKPAGRGRQLRESAVKEYAREQGLFLIQPEKLKDEDFAGQLKELNPTLQVVVAFKILPQSIFSLPQYGTFNLHASLLPDYRGAAPINHAIIRGEKKTGVTTFFLDPNVDTGRIIKQKEVAIHEKDNAGTLHDKLMQAGGELVRETVEAIRTGAYETILQEDLIPEGTRIKKAPKIFKDDCRIDWSGQTYDIHNFIRGLSPYPAAWTELAGPDKHTMKIFSSQPEVVDHQRPHGSIHTDDKSYLKVATGDGYIEILELQLSGKKKLSAENFLKGFREIGAYRCE